MIQIENYATEIIGDLRWVQVMTFYMLSMNLGLKSLEKLIKGQKGQKRPRKAKKISKGLQRPKL